MLCRSRRTDGGEYKLLQAKVDGIGTFKFQIRGWAITLMVAFLVSGTAANIPSVAFLSSLFVVGLFYLLDSNQQVWQNSFTRRLRDLENQLVKGSHDSRSARSPGIVYTIAMTAQTGNRVRRFLFSWEAPLFYLLLTVLILAFTAASILRADQDQKPIKIQIVSPSEVPITGAQQ